MRERSRDKNRLEHMLQAIERICRYTKGKNFEDFIADDMMYYAVVKNIEILGEASNMLTEEFRQAHSKTPWKQVECIWPDCTSSRNADGITVLSPFFCSYTIYTVEPSEKLSKTSTFCFFPLNPNRNHQDSPRIGMQKYTIYRR